jgi:hypothetical protein
MSEEIMSEEIETNQAEETEPEAKSDKLSGQDFGQVAGGTRKAGGAGSSSASNGQVFLRFD